MNPFVKQIEYAVRGAIVERASALEKELLKVWSCTELFSNYLTENKTVKWSYEHASDQKSRNF